ncbi:MAG TPA: hypothetical protein VK060_03500 [Ruania sp.]|nr:hypothetical protein [Ruania sp.]
MASSRVNSLVALSSPVTGHLGSSLGMVRQVSSQDSSLATARRSSRATASPVSSPAMASLASSRATASPASSPPTGRPAVTVSSPATLARVARAGTDLVAPVAREALVARPRGMPAGTCGWPQHW